MNMILIVALSMLTILVNAIKSNWREGMFS